MVNREVYKSKAKINLFLHVLSVETNGFHNLQSITYFPNIFDELTFSVKDIFSENPIDNTIKATGEFASFLPRPKNNSIIKVIEFFQETFSINDNIHVNLKKNLPIGGGIGGGSSNTAITIMAMNDIFNLGLSFLELLDIAKKFGSDVPVCMYQNSATFEGKGEITNPINLPELPILLINPKEPLITSKVFKTFDDINKQQSDSLNSNKIDLKNLQLDNFQDLINFLNTTKNNLTDASISLNGNILSILKSLKHTNPVLSRMSGSGSSCFAIYNKASELQMAKKTMKALYPKAWIALAKN